MTQKLIIDADPGIGDALAILAAIADPSLDVIGLTAVAGSVSGIQATRNLQYLVGLADPLRHPRIGQSEQPGCAAELAPPGLPHQQALNGRFGLGETEPLVPELHHRRESAKLIIELAKEHSEDIRLLTFGPLTNLAIALEMDPQLSTHLSGVICCGGSISRGGDVTAAAEFNFWADPAAAQTVLRSPIGVLLVPLDVSELPTLTFEDVDRLTGLIPSTPVGELIAGQLQYSMRATRQLLPREVVAFPAATALAVAARATKYSTVQLTMDVETTGELTSGQVVVDRRPFVLHPAMTDVVSDLDEVAVTDFFCRGLKRMAVAADMS